MPAQNVSSSPKVDHPFWLSDYEAANLAQALVFLGSVGGNTGDWHGQLIHRLNQLDIGTSPNKHASEQRRELAMRAGWDLLWGGR